MAEYIDKAEALSRFSFYNGDRIPERDVDGFPNTITFHDAKAVIRSIRPADVRPVVRGRWVYDKDASDWGIGGYVCSECKNKNNNLPCNRVKSVQLFSGAKFCPNCGADMRGGSEE